MYIICCEIIHWKWENLSFKWNNIYGCPIRDNIMETFQVSTGYIIPFDIRPYIYSLCKWGLCFLLQRLLCIFVSWIACLPICVQFLAIWYHITYSRPSFWNHHCHSLANTLIDKKRTQLVFTFLLLRVKMWSEC